MVVSDTPAPLRSNRLKVYLIVLILFLFDKPIEASEIIFQFGVQSLKGIRQLVSTAVINMYTSLRLT